jgi:hypothetical protein
MGTLAVVVAWVALLWWAWLMLGWAGRACDRWTARREAVRAEDAAIARAKATLKVGNARGIMRRIWPDGRPHDFRRSL